MGPVFWHRVRFAFSVTYHYLLPSSGWGSRCSSP